MGQFVEVVQPDILSFDSYPNFTPTDAEDGKQIYMANLEVIRTYALQVSTFYAERKYSVLRTLLLLRQKFRFGII